MIINSIIIRNFRCYKDETKLDFNRGGKITFILGKSGYGKSSFIHFLRWMFYGDVDFGKTDDKPLYNQITFEESKPGNLIEVYGKIEFEHNSVKYSLTRTVVFKCGLTEKLTRVEKSDLILQHLVNDNWVRYTDDVPAKINSLMPKELSKYFFLYGEQAREIVLDSAGLKKAIHQLFGIAAYEKAIGHIGKEANRNSVLGYYSIERLSKLPRGYDTANIAEIQANLQATYDKMTKTNELVAGMEEQLKKLTTRQKELLINMGGAANKENLRTQITNNKKIIDDYENQISKTEMPKIGNLFYKNYPYLLLANKAAECSIILKEKNKEFEDASSLYVFKFINKPLLKEISDKGVCVCGRNLDNESSTLINKIMNSMPPDSYTYQFKQFVSKIRETISCCVVESYKYQDIIDTISSKEVLIKETKEKNEDLLKELEKLDSMKEMVEEYSGIESEISNISKKLDPLKNTAYILKQGVDRYESQLKSMDKGSEITALYDAKILAFKKILVSLINGKASQEAKVKVVLNDCVRDIYERLTTQKEDASRINFIKDDFSLRETYLTGGQMAVDQYSYIIGIIKALKECGFGYKENTIVVDAPFAFTDEIQSEHIFETLPLISEQSILLSLDINKVKNSLLKKKDIYDFYVIHTDEKQRSATLVPGTIKDIEELL